MLSWPQPNSLVDTIKTHAQRTSPERGGDCTPGLYAAGAPVGIFYRHPAATSVLRGAVFGRIAGAHAA
jgi:tricarballylate dehydrogenase